MLLYKTCYPSTHIVNLSDIFLIRVLNTLILYNLYDINQLNKTSYEEVF
jgi:hypothetical protein